MFLLKCILIVQLYLVHRNFAQRTCLKSYSNYVIWGNDLTSVAGSTSTCCQACQKNSQCLAYTWTNDNGGTCWLKTDVQPLVNATAVNVTNAFTGVMSPTANETYSLIKTYQAPTFFDDFWFDNRNGHVFGFAKFVGDNETAWEKGLIKYENDKVYIGVDHTTVIPNGTWGRLGIRINTFQLYDSGLFILNMDHLPTGPYTNGTGWQDSPVWPAWWMNGDNGYNGEFDMYEGYAPNKYAFITIHDWDKSLYGNCTMPANITSYFDGYGTMYGGGSQLSPMGTADTAFNAAGGGAYVMQWNKLDKYIRVWTFTKQTLPADIVNNSPNPNPSTWGQPNAYFPLGENCNENILTDDYIIFDITFCNPPVESYCEDIVRNHPEDFLETYFLINYMKVFCRPNEKCLTGIYGSGK